MTSLLAIVCVRNEAVHIERCLTDLIASGCEVVLIDNDSTDETRALAAPFLGHGLLRMERLPWQGTFSLSDQIRVKARIVEAARHDWILHADADEWLVSPVEGETLALAVGKAQAEGYNVINFHECVFVPTAGEDYYRSDYAAHMRDYHFFQPRYPRLNRAWQRSACLEYRASGGHILSGARLRRYPRDLILRHYIALSERHARAKYLCRRFSDEDLQRKWHANRVIITEANLKLRSHPGVRRLADPLVHDFDLSQPLREHFWQWPSSVSSRSR